MKALFLPLCWVLLVSPLALRAQSFRTIDGTFNDMAYDAVNDRIYVVIGGGTADGNAILALDATTGAELQRIEVGSEPSLVRVSDNGRYLYVMLQAAPYLQRYDLVSGAFDPPTLLLHLFDLYGNPVTQPTYQGDLIPLPGNGQSWVLSETVYGYSYGLAVYDNTTVRPNQPNPFGQAGIKLVLSDDGQTVWGLGDGNVPGTFKRYQLDAQGLTEVSSHPNLILQEATHVVHQNGRIYVQNGQIFDVTGSEPVLVHTFDIGQSWGNFKALQAPATDANVIYQIRDFDPADPFLSNYQGMRLRLFDKTTFAEQANYRVTDWNYSIVPTKMLYLREGRLAVLGKKSDGSKKLLLFNETPCPAPNLGLAVSPATPMTACFGDTLTLQAAPGYSNYYWSNGGIGPTLKVTSNTFLTDSFSYRVLDANGCLSEPSPYTLVHFDQRPTGIWYSLESSNDILCPGQKGGIYPSSDASWRFVCSTTGDTINYGQKFVVTEPGVYTIHGLSQFGCPSPSVSVKIFEALPGETVPTLTASGPLTFCANTPTVLSAPPGAFGYEWSNGATTRSITPPFNDRYAVRLKYANGCVGAWSDTAQINIKYVPPMPSLSETFGGLVVNTAQGASDSLQWSFNGQLLPGVGGTVYAPQENGFYSVQNFYEGCPSPPSPLYAYPQPVSVTLNGSPYNPEGTVYYITPSVTPASDYTFVWSNWSSNFGSAILADQAGSYCVTVTRTSDGYTATACLELVLNDQLEVLPLSNNVPVAGMPVVLFKRSGQEMTPLDTVVTASNGKALFENIIPQGYTFLAAPTVGSPLADQFLPTYFYSSLLWSDANVFTTNGLRLSTQPIGVFVINLYPAQMLTGNGTVSGFLTDGPGFAAPPTSDGGVTANGDPLAGVSVLLYDANGNIVAATVTDANGYYSFGNLPPGTYTVWVNLPGVPPASQTVTLTSGSPTAGAVSFALVNGVFEIVSGTTDLTTLNARLWPNPTSGSLWLKTPVAVSLQVANALGMSILQQKLNAGQHTLNVLEGQPAGVYFVKLKTEDGRIGVSRLAKQ